MNAMTAAAWATQVLFAQEILDLDARGFGLLLTAEALGGVLGGQLASRISRRIGPGTSLFVVLAGDGLALGLAGLTSTPLVFAALTAVGSFLALLWNVITVSLRQTIIPDHLLGRVNSVYRFFGWGMMPLGGLLGGGLVVLGTNLAGREAGLRLPWLVAGAAHLVMFVLALRELSTARIEAAKEEAVRT
jgi:MFS family permease